MQSWVKHKLWVETRLGLHRTRPCHPGKGEAAPEEMVSSDEVVSVLNMVISAEIKTVYPEGGCVCRELVI